MKCKTIEKKLAVREPLTLDEAAHLRSCLCCSQFARTVQQFKGVDLETPNWVVMQTRKMFTKIAGQKPPSRRLLFHTAVQFWRSPKTALALSILFTLALLTAIFALLFCERSALTCQAAAVFALFVLAQNIVTALFIPVLIQQKIIPTQSHGENHVLL